MLIEIPIISPDEPKVEFAPKNTSTVDAERPIFGGVILKTRSSATK